MSRHQSQGVVLTGYHSNAELLPQTELCGGSTSSCPPVPNREPDLLSRKTGHYSLEHNQSTQQQEDKYGPSLATSGRGASNTESGSSSAAHPGSQPSSSPKLGSSPRHSPNSKPRKQPTCQRSFSQDSLDELEMDDYWTEIENIKSSGEGHGRGGGEGETQEEEQQKAPEEGEHEEAWLTKAGLVRLVDDSLAAEDHEEDSAVFLSTLTRTQAAAVQLRVSSYQQTLLRRRNRQHFPDVRDIFRPHEKNEEPPKLKEESDKDATTVETETELNVEVAFSEQALSYRDNNQRLKVNSSLNSSDDKLPNFKLLRDKTGQTRVGDLSPLDMKKVHRLVLVEMTALFDTAGIDVKANKPGRVKSKESGLFGVPLITLLDQDHRQVPGTKVPLILQRLISHVEEEGLDTEGLLRIPGSATRVKSLCQELESSFYDRTFQWEQVKQHDAASLLKLFIRELPHPLLTVEYLNAFIAVNSVYQLPTKKQQLQALNLLVLLLPEANRDTLKALVEFFQRVINHQVKNKMTLNNVSVVMAPNIFMFKGFRSKVTEQQEFSMATSTANIVRLLIRYQNLLWTIPKFILTQVRQQNMENQRKLYKDRAVRKLLKKITIDRPIDKAIPEENTQGIIRVQAPQFSKISMAIQLTEDLQAADVLTRFLSQDSSVSVKKEDLCLYEIGGNIKERCLDGETYMKDLSQLNPAAEWVIKEVQR